MELLCQLDITNISWMTVGAAEVNLGTAYVFMFCAYVFMFGEGLIRSWRNYSYGNSYMRSWIPMYLWYLHWYLYDSHGYLGTTSKCVWRI